jgi:AcrR family transcriptional regulator
MPPSPSRRRNAAATRQAILDSARKAFAQAGYDGVGVREIARAAGVTAMLVNRYFGSKEQLFAEVAAATMGSPLIVTEKVVQSGTPGLDLARALVGLTAAGETPLEGFLIMLHSASSPRAAAIGRDQIEQRHQRVMTGALSGNLAPERAALVLALIAGVQVMRQMIGLQALVQADPQTLVELLGPMFQQLIQGQG